MGKTWEDLGDGQWKLTVTDDLNRVPPATVYGTKDEITEKLADSKINGDRRIAELKGSNSLTAGDRMQAVADLQNPAKFDQAITRVVETIVGPVEDFNRDRSESREEREIRMAVAAATTFTDNTPDWYPSEHNKKTLTEYMKRLGLSHSNASHYTQAFNELKEANLLQPPPAGNGDEGDPTTQSTEIQAERTAPAPPKPQTPTRYSTGVRQSDVSGRQPVPSNRLKYTREQIDRMSTKVYAEKMKSDPDFVKAVETLYSRSSQRRAS